MKKLCKECGDKLVGRIDKIFCSDQCRNTHNNRLNADKTKIIRNVNNQLRRNRRILASIAPEKTTKISRDLLLQKGFNFSYFTSIYTNKKNQTYYFVYDYGYVSLGKQLYAVVKKKNE
ncbi:MAG: hypothetical protein ACQESK_04275 [Bacteroidota bacterium]